MSCYGCTKQFGILNREHGCGNCGFGFCSVCLKYRTVVPGKGPKEIKVCGACYALVCNPAGVEKVYAPPAALQKRLDALEHPGGTPVIIYKDNRKMASLRKGLSQDDQKIVDRLEKLQRERKEKTSIPSDTELRDRLSKLKDENPNTAPIEKKGTGTAFYKPPDKRTDEEKRRDLLEGIQKEVEIDSKILTPEQDIAIRLARLRGQDPENLKNPSIPSLHNPDSFLQQYTAKEDQENIGDMDVDEVAKLLDIVGRDVELDALNAVRELEKDKAIQEQLAKLRIRPGDGKKMEVDPDDTEDVDEDEDEDETERITKQILAEQELEERLSLLPDYLPGFGPEGATGADSITPGLLDPSSPGRPESNKDDEPEELPWCVICNEDASLRCRGCDNDLYCRGCYKEFHVDEDLNEHKQISFSR